MGQIYMGRENPFGELVVVLTADEFLLLRKADDERRCRDEVGVGKLSENAVAYLPGWHCRCCDRGLPSSRVTFSSIVASRSPR